MTTPRNADERLQDAFQSFNRESQAEASAEDVERVWRAVSGELPADERREVVERTGGEPALAEAWRIAGALREAQCEQQLVVAKRASWTPAWLGLAAVLALVVGISVVQFREPPADSYRDGGRYLVESQIASEAALPADAFTLRWKPGPEGSRYQIRVMTEDLKVVSTATDLTLPEFTVPRDSLTGVAPGSRVLWQVTVSLPGGDTVPSQTFVVRTQ